MGLSQNVATGRAHLDWLPHTTRPTEVSCNRSRLLQVALIPKTDIARPIRPKHFYSTPVPQE